MVQSPHQTIGTQCILRNVEAQRLLLCSRAERPIPPGAHVGDLPTRIPYIQHQTPYRFVRVFGQHTAAQCEFWGVCTYHPIHVGILPCPDIHSGLRHERIMPIVLRGINQPVRPRRNRYGILAVRIGKTVGAHVATIEVRRTQNNRPWHRPITLIHHGPDDALRLRWKTHVHRLGYLFQRVFFTPHLEDRIPFHR